MGIKASTDSMAYSQNREIVKHTMGCYWFLFDSWVIEFEVDVIPTMQQLQ